MIDRRPGKYMEFMEHKAAERKKKLEPRRKLASGLIHVGLFTSVGGSLTGSIGFAIEQFQLHASQLSDLLTYGGITSGIVGIVGAVAGIVIDNRVAKEEIAGVTQDRLELSNKVRELEERIANGTL